MALSAKFAQVAPPVYTGKVATDKWYTVLLADDTDAQTGETGIASGSLTVEYAAVDGSTTWTSYSVSASDWYEINNGAYGLRIGAGEFTAAGQYAVRVGDTTPDANLFVFVVEVHAVTLDDLVRSTTPANTLAVDASGRTTIGAIATGAITADSIASNAITDSKINADAITAAKIADDSISSDQIADGAITAAKLGADCITAAKIADDSITSDQLSTSAADAIADEVWDEATSGHTSAGTFGEQVKTDIDAILTDTGTTIPGTITTVDSVVDAIKVKTDGLNFTGTDVKATLDGETVTPADGSITAAKLGADAITAAKVASDVTDEIADGVWDEATSGHTTAGTFGEQVKTDIDAILTDTGSTGVQVDLTQAYSEGQSRTTIGGALEAAESNIRNKKTDDGSYEKIYESDGTTTLIVREVITDGWGDSA